MVCRSLSQAQECSVGVLESSTLPPRHTTIHTVVQVKVDSNISIKACMYHPQCVLWCGDALKISSWKETSLGLELLQCNLLQALIFLHCTSIILVLYHKLLIEFQNRHLCLIKSLI